MPTAVCFLLLSLELVSLVPGLKGQESGALTFIDVSSTGNTDASISVTSPEIPFEGEIHSTLTILRNGVIIFGELLSSDFSPPTSGFPTERFPYLVSPFWTSDAINSEVEVVYAVFKSTDVATQEVDAYINSAVGTSDFAANWMLVVSWESAVSSEPEEEGSDVESDTDGLMEGTGSGSGIASGLMENLFKHFQAVVVSDGSASYVVFIYKCGSLDWNEAATVGFSSPVEYANHHLSGNNAGDIDCEGELNSEWYNVLYTLEPNDGKLTKGKDYLPFIQLGRTPGVDSVELARRLDGVSRRNAIPLGLPFGHAVHKRAYVGTNGIISFGRPWYFYYPFPFPTFYWWTRNAYVVAPFWNDHDIRKEGGVTYEIQKQGESDLSDRWLGVVSDFVNYQFEDDESDEEFKGTWMLVAQWTDVHLYPHGSYWFYSTVNKANTYQAAIITNGVKTYSVFTYNCQMMQWSGLWRYSTIGFNARGLYYKNHLFTGQPNANLIACENMEDTPWSNVVYQLSISEDLVQSEKAKCMNLEATALEKNGVVTDSKDVIPCPCSLWQAWRDRRFRFLRDYSIGFCYYRRRNSSPDSVNQICCYSLSWPTWGALIIDHELDGSSYFIDPRGTKSTLDKDFRLTCCGIAGLCDVYYQLRPTITCSGYVPPRWTWGWGDPHFTTLDNRTYTFNGRGEYMLVRSTNGAGGQYEFALQARTEPVSEESNATQFTAFACGLLDTEARVEVQINETGHLAIFCNGSDVSDNLTNINDTVEKELVDVTRESNSSVSMAFSNGVSVTVTATVGGGGMLNFVLLVPTEFEGNLEGLLGNFNGNQEDDLEFRNGTQLPSDAPDSLIHQFGQSWQISEEESLFTYPPGMTTDDYSYPDHSPVFLDELLPNADPEIVEFCDGDPQCVYDYTETNDSSIANSTKMTNMENVNNSVQATNNPPMMFGPGSFLVTYGQQSVYSFNVSDDSDDAPSVMLMGDPPAATTLTHVGEGKYEFSWTLQTLPENVSSLVFVATDSMEAVSTLSPLLEVCACQNDGNCSSDEILSSVHNVIVMDCICHEAWEGSFCEMDVNGCTEVLCYDGVQCYDVQAPGAGAECGSCPVGLSGEGIKCADVDECNSTDTNMCEQLCVNTEGSFECGCMSGYTVDPAALDMCIDVDECSLFSSNCEQICTNTPGSFACECYTGFQLSSTDNATCNVMMENECLMNICSDGGVCAMENGMEKCFCDLGYVLDAEINTTCADVNECDLNPNLCNNGMCVNTVGGFSCECGEGGFRLDDSDMRTCIEFRELTAEVVNSYCSESAESNCDSNIVEHCVAIDNNRKRSISSRALSSLGLTLADVVVLKSKLQESSVVSNALAVLVPFYVKALDGVLRNETVKQALEYAPEFYIANGLRVMLLGTGDGTETTTPTSEMPTPEPTGGLTTLHIILIAVGICVAISVLFILGALTCLCVYCDSQLCKKSKVLPITSDEKIDERLILAEVSL